MGFDTIEINLVLDIIVAISRKYLNNILAISSS